MNTNIFECSGNDIVLKQQNDLLVSLLIALLYQKTNESPEIQLLKKLAIERHNKEHLNTSFFECWDDSCNQVVKIISSNKLHEATLFLDEIKQLKGYKFKCKSHLAGVLTISIEKENIIQI
jgi:hypothetical protein